MSGIRYQANRTVSNPNRSIVIEQQTQATVASALISNLINTGRITIGDTVLTEGTVVYTGNNMTVTVIMSVAD